MHDMNFRTWPIFASMNHPTNANVEKFLFLNIYLTQLIKLVNFEGETKSL